MLGYKLLCAMAPPDLTSFGDPAFASPHLDIVTIPYRTFPRTGAETPYHHFGLVHGISYAWRLLRDRMCVHPHLPRIHLPVEMQIN